MDILKFRLYNFSSHWCK